MSNYGHPYASTVINYIYHTLQLKFFVLEGGHLTSKGHYSRFLVNQTHQGDFPKSLVNINRKSWEDAFLELVWQPGGNVQRRIRRALRDCHSVSHLRQKLARTLGKEFQYKIDDIISYLETMGLLKHVRSHLTE